MMHLIKEHQNLLIQRESLVVLGKKAINLWLLVIVLLATFLAIAFSAGSMAYLDEKMNDPFTYWLNVYRESAKTDLKKIAEGLKQDSIASHFLYNDVQTEIATSLDLVDEKDKMCLFTIQHYEDMNSDLIKKVLSEENVLEDNGNLLAIDTKDSINERSIGVIMTIDAVRRMGYDTHDIPAFVNCRVPAKDADTLGFKVIDGYVRAPLPLLGVVRRLPMNKDMLASKYLYVQYNSQDITDPFNMSKETYARRLYFFVPSEVTDFEKNVKDCFPDSLKGSVEVLPTEASIAERLQSWRKGAIMTVYPGGLPPLSVINETERNILDKFASRGVTRVYHYDESIQELGENLNIDNGLSIHFVKLDSIRAFENYMKNKWNLQLEMTQVNSKENFNAVSTMANILTVALIVFAIIAIVIFIVNMLQSYFQKVRRNLGTFKAFGISIRELTGVYMVIIIGIVLTALVIGLLVTWCTELLLPLLGMTKEGGAPHLILWNSRTLWAVIIILVSTIVSVLVVMRRLLRQTPGDLIYDR